jgi:hypothetical protein
MQEYEQLGHINRINEDASGLDEELLLPHTSRGFEESATRTCVVFNTPLQSFAPIYYTINNYTGFAAMVR